MKLERLFRFVVLEGVLETFNAFTQPLAHFPEPVAAKKQDPENDEHDEQQGEPPSVSVWQRWGEHK
jgi:hypothetical protein